MAVLLRALVPVGYMPNFNGDNAFQLVTCTAQGAASIPADDAYNPFQKTPVTSHDAAKLCDFSLNSVHPMHVASPDFVFVILVIATAFITSRREFVLARRRTYSPSSPRAPPRFV